MRPLSCCCTLLTKVGHKASQIQGGGSQRHLLKKEVQSHCRGYRYREGTTSERAKLRAGAYLGNCCFYQVNQIRRKYRCCTQRYSMSQRNTEWGFPAGPGAENLPCGAGDTSLIPGPGRSHMPRGNCPQATTMEPGPWSPGTLTREPSAKRRPQQQLDSSPALHNWRKLKQQQRPRAAINIY